MPTEMPDTTNDCRFDAMPEAHDAIRYDAEDDEPPALMFNGAASPGALVSWAWSQLATLSTLLLSQSMERTYYEPDDVGLAVRAIIVPVMNALKLSEQRAYELRKTAGPPHD